MYRDYDAYVIHALNPDHIDQPPILAADTDITFLLQKYHFSHKQQKFRTVFNRGVPFHFHIDKCLDDSYSNPQLPIWFDGAPRLPLPQNLTISARTDRLLSQLSPRLRLVFRYDPTRNVGCLVHFGYDFAELDRAPLLYLWMTADNLEQKQQAELKKWQNSSF